MANQNQPTRIRPDHLLEFCTRVFAHLDVPEDDAWISADVLVSANLRGVDSHGVARLKRYVAGLRSGQMLPRPQVQVVHETGDTALLDGGGGLGQPIGVRGMKLALEKAQQNGTGFVTVRNSNHFGIAGYYPLMAAKEGLVGLAVTNARPSMSPTFGAQPMLGTNPIAFAAPSDMPFPFCFDGATTIAQRGKIEVAARAEKPVPAGWVIDDQGRDMTDPDVILEGLTNETASMLPLGGAGEAMAGYKGYGLAVIVEILSAALSGGPFMHGLSGLNADGSPAPHRLGHYFLAIDVTHYVPLDVFRGIVGNMARELQASKKAQGAERIYVAGEKEYERELAVRAKGVPVNANLRKTLVFLRDKLSVPGYEAYF